MILSTNEHLVSNNKALEFYESIKAYKKQLIVSKHITHNT